MADFNKLQTKQVLSETQFYIVEKIVGDKVQLGTESGKSVVLDKGYVEVLLTSADQYETTEKITRTELAELLVKNPNVAMTVNFNKKVDEKEVLKEMLDVHRNTAPKDVEKQFKLAVKKALEGEERTAVGRHNGHINQFGRLDFIDMGKEKKSSSAGYDGRQIQVDPRTINWLILRGVRYEAK